MSPAAAQRERIRNWLKNLNLNEPLECHDARYQALDAFRGGDWTLPLYNCIHTSPDYTCQLFSGCTGSGKTTELNRLKSRLAQDFTVIMVNGGNYHGLTHPLSISELLIIAGAALSDGISELLNRSPGDVFWNKVSDFLQTRIELDKVQVKFGPITLKGLIRDGSGNWKNMVPNSVLGDLVTLIHEEIRVQLEKIKEQTGKEVVFILDSLEKIRGSTEPAFAEVIASVVESFSRYPKYLQLPGCHVIYTIPPYVSLVAGNIAASYDGAVYRPLPAVKVSVRKEPSAQVRSEELYYQPGIDALADLLAGRIPIDEIFPPDRILLHRIIFETGGHIRTLIDVTRKIVSDNLGKSFPVAEADVLRILRMFAETAEQGVRPEAIPLLEGIRQTHLVDHVSGQDLHLLARYVDRHMVLCYQNGDGWYLLHPFIEANVKRRSAGSGP